MGARDSHIAEDKKKKQTFERLRTPMLGQVGSPSG
jgi:hypothetical protein